MKFYRTVVDFLKPEDKVYFLGDAGDRGPEPWETIKAIAQDSQFIYLKGNHEDMLVDALKDAIQHDYMGGWRLLASNGGSDTFDQAMAEEDTLVGLTGSMLALLWKNMLMPKAKPFTLATLALHLG
jgi:hypothetical protein